LGLPLFTILNKFVEYWDLLLKGQSQERDFSDDKTGKRWNFHHYYHPDPQNPGTATHKTVAFIDDIDKFDSEFFRFSPKEASEMDPQQRILLETSFESLEDAGILTPFILFVCAISITLLLPALIIDFLS
jgi:phthiocerol/phenolphthiocerol synthesis type-I polyketide synthase B